MRILLFSGKAKHGKDTTANILKSKLENKGKKVLILHFADYLKFVCEKVYMWNGIKDDAGRVLLQKVGTDIARRRYPNIWVDTVVSIVKAFGRDFDYILVPDCRFHNEVGTLKSYWKDTLAIRVTRNGFDNGLTEEQKNHKSETELDNYKFDVEIGNPEGLDNLEKVVDKFVLQLDYI